MRRFAVLVACAIAVHAGAAAAAPPVDARAWVVVDAGTGDVLTAHAADEHLPIASITKLMTVLVVLDHHRLTDVIRVDPRVPGIGEESIDLRAGEELSVADLLRGALVQSANDAADALALATAPSFTAFAKLMNAKAAQLGLHESHFVRPDGLDAPDEYASAHDVTVLAQDAMKIPFVRETVAERVATIPGRTLYTWNRLLGVVPGVVGVKTGHTDNAGWCQVAARDVDGDTMYVTILGSPSEGQRDTDLKTLLAWAANQYRLVDAITVSHAYAQVDLPYGRGRVPLVAKAPLQSFVRVGRPLTERVVASASTSLPVAKGAVLGHVEVWSGRRLLGRRPLVAARSVASPGLTGRVGWYARRTVHDALGLFT